MEIKIVILPEEDGNIEEVEQNPEGSKEKTWKITQVGGEEVYTDSEGKVYRQNLRIPR